MNYKIYFPNLSIGIIAIILMILSGICATTVQTIVKYTSQLNIHPFQIAFFRSLLVIPLVMPFFIKSGLRNLKTNNPKLTFLRSIVGSIALICFFYGLSFTEIAKVQALIFLVPIFASILAIFFLKEIVGIRRWIAMGFAFCGALIILNPNVEVTFGPLLILISCFFWSASVLINKLLTKTDTNSSIVFWQSIGVIPATFFISIPVWIWPDLYVFMLLMIIAMLATLTHFMLTAALKRGQISFLLPFDYLRLIWSVLLGYYIFSEVPAINVWIGSVIIICSTAYISFREYKLNIKDKDKTFNSI